MDRRCFVAAPPNDSQPPQWTINLDDAFEASLWDRKLYDNLQDNNALTTSRPQRPVENQHVEKSIKECQIL